MNPYISQCSEAFDAEKSSQYRMAIQFALGGLSFALLDNTTNALVGLEFYQSDLLSSSNDLFRTLERALASKGLNNQSFLSVTCLFDNRFCTLVPAPLFNEAEQDAFLNFTFQIPEGHVTSFERIEKASCFNVYAFPKALHDMVVAKWKNVQMGHTTTLFINEVLASRPATSISLNVRNRDFDMVILKDGKLHFFNNFRFNTKEDFTYFLLFAMEQNGVTGEDVPVCFSGLIRPASEIIDLCGRYVRDIHFVEAPETLRSNKAFNEVPYPYYHIHYQALK